jgi:deazaflavin-dependent oxidoreductase (nitroreductase family)
MPSDLAFKAMNAIHRSLLRDHRRARWVDGLNMPVLELTTTGRQTGRSRTVMLTSPVQEGTTLVVVASRGGDDKAPAWFLNLQDNPEVGVALQGKPTQPNARAGGRHRRTGPTVAPGGRRPSELRRLPDQTTREIALVLLEPSPRS